MDKRTAIRQLASLGFRFDDSVTGHIGGCWMATIDPIGAVSIGGECRGIVVHDYTATASEFWTECVEEARGQASLLMPCDDPDCDMHGDHDA